MKTHENKKKPNKTTSGNEPDRASAELTRRIAELQKANEEIKNSRIAALNVMEDAILSREALRDSEERFRTLANSVPHIIWSNDAEGRANYFNQRWYEYSGLSFEESEGPGWQVLVHPDDEHVAKEKWRQALHNGREFNVEYRLRGVDNDYRWFIGRNMPVRDARGKVTGWFGSATDIDDLKRTQADLVESRERLRVTLESATDYSIITLDTDGNIAGWSKGAEQCFNYRESEAVGQYTAIIFTPEDREAGVPEKEILTALNEGVALDERWHMRKDGTRFFMNGVMRPIYNPGLTGYVKVARDMTQQKLAEQQKDEFIGVASHELKTPVTSIQSYAELLQESLAQSGDKDNKVLADKVTEQIERLSNLINTLLDTTRITEGRLELHLQPCNLDELVAEYINDLRLLSPGHRLVLRTGTTPEVLADRERIVQVLTNLVSNAIKYSPNGGEVIISTSYEEGIAKVSVQDEGIGMTEETAKHVFEKFYRVRDKRVETFPGIGLGLYIAAEIVKMHGGMIWVVSEPGKGSTFYFTIPIGNKQNKTP